MGSSILTIGPESTLTRRNGRLARAEPSPQCSLSLLPATKRARGLLQPHERSGAS